MTSIIRFKMVTVVCATVLFTGLFMFFCNSSSAGEVDILVRKLVEKGVLTNGEAQQILTETKEEVRKEVAKAESYATPSWAQKINIKGDLRTRYQTEKVSADNLSENAESPRNRGRIRFRIGGEAKVTDKLNVGFGLATGSSDARSTNQSFDGTFETGDIRLDYAYAEYSPLKWLNLIAGKFKRDGFIWSPSDLLWDSDVRVDGVGVHTQWQPDSNLNTFVNSTFLVLEESSSAAADPIMWSVQPGFKWDIFDNKAYLKSSFNYYGFNGLKGKTLTNTSGSNTLQSAPRNGLLYDYDSIGASAELGINDPLGTNGIFAYMPYLGIFGDFLNNLDPDDDDIAWLIGAKIGDAKVKKQKQWQLKYIYRRLEKDAWVDALSDSDFFNGETDAKGHEIILEYGLFDNVTLGLDYYRTKQIKATNPQTQDLLQADIVFKF